MYSSTVYLKLTPENLDGHGWLFSKKMGVMICEHESGEGNWDIEIFGYRPVNEVEWTPDTNIFSAYANFLEMRAEWPELFAINDWVDGDTIKMW